MCPGPLQTHRLQTRQNSAQFLPGVAEGDRFPGPFFRVLGERCERRLIGIKDSPAFVRHGRVGGVTVSLCQLERQRPPVVAAAQGNYSCR